MQKCNDIIINTQRTSQCDFFKLFYQKYLNFSITEITVKNVSDFNIITGHSLHVRVTDFD